MYSVLVIFVLRFALIALLVQRKSRAPHCLGNQSKRLDIATYMCRPASESMFERAKPGSMFLASTGNIR